LNPLLNKVADYLGIKQGSRAGIMETGIQRVQRLNKKVTENDKRARNILDNSGIFKAEDEETQPK
jgi:hypothetical protein